MTMSRIIRLKVWRNSWEEAWKIIFTHDFHQKVPQF